VIRVSFRWKKKKNKKKKKETACSRRAGIEMNLEARVFPNGNPDDSSNISSYRSNELERRESITRGGRRRGSMPTSRFPSPSFGLVQRRGINWRIRRFHFRHEKRPLACKSARPPLDLQAEPHVVARASYVRGISAKRTSKKPRTRIRDCSPRVSVSRSPPCPIITEDYSLLPRPPQSDSSALTRRRSSKWDLSSPLKIPRWRCR